LQNTKPGVCRANPPRRYVLAVVLMCCFSASWYVADRAKPAAFLQARDDLSLLKFSHRDGESGPVGTCQRGLSGTGRLGTGGFSGIGVLGLVGLRGGLSDTGAGFGS